MADVAFSEMEAEAESFNPSVNLPPDRADKFNKHSNVVVDEEEVVPLLGAPVLAEESNKRWYNTPSVNLPSRFVCSRSQVFWLLPPFLLTALSFGSTMAPKINLYSSLACRDYYSERSNIGLPGSLPGGAYPIFEIGHQSPDCHIPEVSVEC